VETGTPGRLVLLWTCGCYGIVYRLSEADMPEEIVLGLSQGDILSIVIVAVAAVLGLLLLAALLRLSAALVRVGCLVVVIGVFLYALTRMSI
jgi:predicted membrane channel-forming protein YqfA (hemolysin III family)